MMKLILKLALASMKMFFRQREAIIWTILLPLFIIVLFGFIRFDGLGRMHLGIVNEAGERGGAITAALRNVKTVELFEGAKDQELRELEKGERDVVLVIPEGFDPAGKASVLLVADPEGKPRETQLAALVLQRVVDEMVFARTPEAARITVQTEAVKIRNLTYIDFLIPGVLSMGIMQMGIFGVAFSFVSLKKRGILRRLSVTPIRPRDFIIAQVLMRLVALIIQMVVMVGVGVLFFHLHFTGNPLTMFVTGVLGATVFLGIGFTLAGISKSEDQVAPLANLITLPMMLLSGVFFSRSNLPGIVRHITEIFPLTFLADGLRAVAIDGATLVQILPQIGGLLIWSVATILLASKLFRWE
jgi:ABC-2 type transport system permease protein